MKKYLAGFIVGVMLTMGFTVFADEVKSLIAEPATFEVFVGGEKFESDKPVAVIDGSTYLPLKATSEVLGVDVQWNAEKRRVEIGTVEEIAKTVEDTKTVEVVSEPTSTPKPISTPAVVNSNQITQKSYYFESSVLPKITGKFPMITKDGEYYLLLSLYGGSNIVYPDGDKNFVIKLLGKELEVSTDNSLKYQGQTFVKLSSVGLKARIEGDTVYIEAE